MGVELPVYCSEECKLIHKSTTQRLEQLENVVADHRQRFDTLQTPWWKRVWFWLQGWPWYDLNGVQQHRPWYRHR